MDLILSICSRFQGLRLGSRGCFLVNASLHVMRVVAGTMFYGCCVEWLLACNGLYVVVFRSPVIVSRKESVNG